MTSDATRAVGRADAACLACGGALPEPLRFRKERFCGETCRRGYASLPAHKVCAVCGRPLSAREFGGRVCGAVECRWEDEGPRRERDRLRLERLHVRGGEIRDRAAAALGVGAPETYTVTVVPVTRGRIVNLPERRRRAFRDGLNRLVGLAAAHAGSGAAEERAEPSDPADVLAVLGGGCALCQGFCCRNGGEHAYLTAATLRRYMAEHPGERPRDVLAAYLGRVGNKSVDGSCVFHQAGGCSLPAPMRSETCNRYFCDGLTGFPRARPAGEPARAFFVAASLDEVRAAAFVDAEGLRQVDPAKDGGG